MDTSFSPSQLPAVDESIENVGAGTAHFLQRHPWYIVATLVAMAVFEVVLVVDKGAANAGYYLVPLVFPLFTYNIARNKVQHEFMQQFAAANGFTYAARGATDGLDGSLFQIGHDRSVVDLVSGQFQNDPISLFTYAYTTGYGKQRQVHHDTIFELQFDTAMPDMLLENVGHTFGESLSLKLSGSGKELVKLEGDFNQYFSLSIPKGYEVEALEIFTPDIMQELIEKAKRFSLEIVNGH
ncbi:MAG TPA: hypothetical protein VMT81_02845, partial [Candidatus Paceibacterota bacterium]|nr:hypothetical protein [Candidatus Paceibacterota bacterium]